MSLVWNGGHTDYFSPFRGIRQEDPLSPYFFVLCMERLSQLINLTMEHKLWYLISLVQDGPKISHLCFVDDIILCKQQKTKLR